MVTSVAEPMTAEGMAIVNSILLSMSGKCSLTNRRPLADMFSVTASSSPCSVWTCRASCMGKRTAVRTGFSPLGFCHWATHSLPLTTRCNFADFTPSAGEHTGVYRRYRGVPEIFQHEQGYRGVG